MSNPIQRWTYDADVGLYCRMDDGGYMLLPHGTVVVLAADAEAHEAQAVAVAVEAARWEWCKVESIHMRREPHAGSCRIFYAENRCSCDAELDAYRQGQRDERQRIRAGVEALPWVFVDPPGVLGTVLAVIDVAPQDGECATCGDPIHLWYGQWVHRPQTYTGHHANHAAAPQDEKED